MSPALPTPDLGSALWFGGPEELVQRFPLSLNSSRARVPYLPGDMLQVPPHSLLLLLQDPEKFLGGVAEPFWVTSLGAGVWVGREQPLWYRWNREGGRQMCLSVEHRRPYVGPSPPIPGLSS